MKESYVFNEAFSEGEYNYLLKTIGDLSYLRFERLVDLRITSDNNEENDEREHFLNFGMQYYAIKMCSDAVLFDPTVFNYTQKEDALIDEAFEELLKLKQLPIKLKDRSYWKKKMMILPSN